MQLKRVLRETEYNNPCVMIILDQHLVHSLGLVFKSKTINAF